MKQLTSPPRNAILHGDCIEVLSGFAPKSIDFAFTDPPYLVHYESRDGRRVRNDDNHDWVEPAFAEIYRVLKFGSYCVSFYGWNRVVHRGFAAAFGAWRLGKPCSSAICVMVSSATGFSFRGFDAKAGT